MRKEIRVWLADIEREIQDIESMLEGMNYEDFKNDMRTQKALNWSLLVIGEAVNRIAKDWPDVPITAKQKIIDARNFLAHNYDTIVYTIIWQI